MTGSQPRSFFDHTTAKLQAIDPDGDAITYSVKGKIGEHHFTVDPLSGVVKLKRKINREVETHFYLFESHFHVTKYYSNLFVWLAFGWPFNFVKVDLPLISHIIPSYEVI